MDKCHICSKSILSHSKTVTCRACSMRFHLNYISLSSDEINDIKDNQQTWFCSPCIAEVFPFNHIEDDVEFVATIEDITVSGTAMCYLSEKVFIPFELNDKDHSSLLCDPDPDLHYFNSFNQVLANSNYFTETSFKEHINKCCDKDAFSICHMNIRSISNKFDFFWNLPWLNSVWFYHYWFGWKLVERYQLWLIWFTWVSFHWTTS